MSVCMMSGCVLAYMFINVFQGLGACWYYHTVRVYVFTSWHCTTVFPYFLQFIIPGSCLQWQLFLSAASAELDDVQSPRFVTLQLYSTLCSNAA